MVLIFARSGTSSSFFDVYEVYDSNCIRFFQCAARMQVEQAFKAELAAFRYRKSRGTESYIFAYFDVGIVERDEMQFLMEFVLPDIKNGSFITEVRPGD